METVNKVVHAASTAIWGEGNDNQSTQPHGEEPISGVQGKGAPNDPYDAGNRDEQPSAPTTDVDPTAQEPKLDYKPQVMDAKTDATSTAVPDASTQTATAVTLPKPTETLSSGVPNESAATEQRSTETTEKLENAGTAAAGGSSSNDTKADASGSGKQGVSEEALKGPQGPAPHPASEFEDEAKGKMPPKETKTNTTESKSPTSSAKSDTSSKSADKSSNGSGKHSTMAKVKEGLKKVAHPRHGSKSSGSSS